MRFMVFEDLETKCFSDGYVCVSRIHVFLLCLLAERGSTCSRLQSRFCRYLSSGGSFGVSVRGMWMAAERYKYPSYLQSFSLKLPLFSFYQKGGAGFSWCVLCSWCIEKHTRRLSCSPVSRQRYHHAHLSRIQSHNFFIVTISCIIPSERALSVIFPC